MELHGQTGSCPATCRACGRGPGTEHTATRKERKELSLTEKVRVLEVLEGPKVSQSELAKRFGVSQPQICRIIKNKERILSEWRRNGNPDRKRSRDGKDGDMEAALLRWVQGARNTQLPISGTWLHMKAKNLAQDVGTARCQHSNGCMARVRVQHNVNSEKTVQDGGDEQHGAVQGSVQGSVHGSVHGSAHGSVQGSVHGSAHGSVHGSAHGSVQDSVQGSVHGSVHGSVQGSVQGSVHKSLPSSLHGSVQGSLQGSLHGSVQGSLQGSMQGSLHDLLHSYAPSELYSCGETQVQLSADGEMLTLLLCTNADGSEKAALRAVGRRANPPYLHGINLQAVPWTYRGGGRLSAALFAEWLQDFNEEMQRKGKSVLLLAEEHEERPYLQLSNVRMLFMPPVATLAHPLHRGIARDLKGHYRRRLLTQVPVVLGSEPPTLLDALHVLAQAWGDVRPELITSCFRATNFSPDSCPDALPAPIWLGQEQLESFGVMDEGLDADMAEGEDWDGGTEESEDSAEPVAVRPCPSEPELWDSMATLRRFLECRATSPDLMQMFYTLQDAVHVVTASAEPALLRDGHPRQ